MKIQWCNKYCKTYYKCRENIIEEIKKLFKNINDKILVGATLYKNSQNKYNVLYSFTYYYDQDNRENFSENDFSGYVFNKKPSENFDYNKIKNHNHLKYFFNNIKIKGQESSNILNNNHYISLIISEKDNDLYLQIYLLFLPDISKEVFDIANKKLEEIKDSFIIYHKCLCLNNILSKVNLKKNIELLREKYILIFDLKRARDLSNFINNFPDITMDTLNTYKYINEFKKIFAKNNFFVLNNTGDGFILIYNGINENIKNDLIMSLKEIVNFFKNIEEFNQELHQLNNNYKLRCIVGKVKYLFQISNGEIYTWKLYFSLELDKMFEDIMKYYKNEDKLTNKNKKIFFYFYKNDKILNGIEKDLKNYDIIEEKKI